MQKEIAGLGILDRRREMDLVHLQKKVRGQDVRLELWCVVNRDVDLDVELDGDDSLIHNEGRSISGPIVDQVDRLINLESGAIMNKVMRSSGVYQGIIRLLIGEMGDVRPQLQFAMRE